MFWEIVVRTLTLVHVATLVGHLTRVAQLQEPELSGQVLAQLAPREVSLLVCVFASRRLWCLADGHAFLALGLVVVQEQEALKQLLKALLPFLGERMLFPRSFEL
jgi:hypothetical protein